jgi:phosphomannomutase
LYPEPDGNFPNHEANPLKTETLRDLQNAVIKECADFGFALDGDADRVGMVDEKGNVVGATYVATLVSQEVLKAHGPGLLLHNPQCGLILGDAWRAAGGTVDFCQTGHANMKKMMLDRGAVFAAEMSLHLYFQDMYNVECGELCFMYLLKRLSDTGEKVSALIAPLETYVHSGEINFETEKKDEAILALEDVYKKDAREISHLDGLWMQLPWGWFNVRKSNTEPVLRLNLETSTKEETERRVNEIQKIIEQL